MARDVPNEANAIIFLAMHFFIDNCTISSYDDAANALLAGKNGKKC